MKDAHRSDTSVERRSGLLVPGVTLAAIPVPQAWSASCGEVHGESHEIFLFFVAIGEKANPRRDKSVAGQHAVHGV